MDNRCYEIIRPIVDLIWTTSAMKIHKNIALSIQNYINSMFEIEQSEKVEKLVKLMSELDK